MQTQVSVVARRRAIRLKCWRVFVIAHLWNTPVFIVHRYSIRSFLRPAELRFHVHPSKLVVCAQQPAGEVECSNYRFTDGGIDVRTYRGTDRGTDVRTYISPDDSTTGGTDRSIDRGREFCRDRDRGADKDRDRDSDRDNDGDRG